MTEKKREPLPKHMQEKVSRKISYLARKEPGMKPKQRVAVAINYVKEKEKDKG